MAGWQGHRAGLCKVCTWSLIYSYIIIQTPLPFHTSLPTSFDIEPDHMQHALILQPQPDQPSYASAALQSPRSFVLLERGLLILSGRSMTTSAADPAQHHFHS